jgi:hypothetical protein
MDLDIQAEKEGGAVYMLNGNHGARRRGRAGRGIVRGCGAARAARARPVAGAACGRRALPVAAQRARRPAQPPGPLAAAEPPAESLNVCGDFRYVTPGAFIESAVEFGIPRDTAMRSWDSCIQARAALFLPGGRVARMLSRNPTVLIVNDTAFAHGGLLPTHGAQRRRRRARDGPRNSRSSDVQRRTLAASYTPPPIPPS